LLFYTPGFAADIFQVRELPAWRILTGTLLAIAVIPLLPLGYWAFSKYLGLAGKRLARAVFIGGIYGAGIGNAIHGMVGTLTRVVQSQGLTAQDTLFIQTYAPFVVSLYAAFYLLMIGGSLLLAVVIWKGRTAFPRWFVLLLPAWSNILVLPLAQVIPALGDLLVPSIANLSHALLFGVMTALFWGREDKLLAIGTDEGESLSGH
jgi:hypothetical protein